MNKWCKNPHHQKLEPGPVNNGRESKCKNEPQRRVDRQLHVATPGRAIEVDVPMRCTEHIDYPCMLHYALTDIIYHLVRELEVVHQLSFENWPELLVGYDSPREESID